MSTYAAGQPIGLDEYFAFDIHAVSPDHTRDELVDGILVVNPLPSGPHQSAAAALIAMLWNACPPELVVMGEMSWVLKTEPLPTVRAADVNSALLRHRRLRSKSSRLIRRSSAIWLRSDTSFELVDGSYREVGRTTVRRRVRVTAPFPVTIDLSRLPVP